MKIMCLVFFFSFFLNDSSMTDTQKMDRAAGRTGLNRLPIPIQHQHRLIQCLFVHSPLELHKKRTESKEQIGSFSRILLPTEIMLRFIPSPANYV
jgi:hypothetical protein